LFDSHGSRDLSKGSTCATALTCAALNAAGKQQSH